MAERGELLTTKQVAEMIGKSVSTVRRLAESGALPAVKLEGPTGVTATYAFDLNDVERYLGAAAQ